MAASPGFEAAVESVVPALLGALEALEHTGRHLHPPRLPSLRERLQPFRAELAEAAHALAATTPPAGLERFHERLATSTGHALEALSGFTSATQSEIGQVLAAMHRQCRALAEIHAIRHAVPPARRFFVERPAWPQIETLDPGGAAREAVGLHEAAGDADGRGGFALFVPESLEADEPLPLVTALHGAMGSGRDFIWSWLREARTRRFLLLAPTSRGSTWSLQGRDVDGPALREMLGYVREHWLVDPARMLLTGLSDGGTYALMHGLAPGSPFTAIAPVASVLHPAVLAAGSLDHAAHVPIRWVHGALDWMFPIDMARAGAEALRASGADVTLREVEDLSHTYPRDENAGMLTAFDPSLAIEGAP